MRIVFLGTPAFAVPSLEALLGEGAQVVGVVTQPDRPRGRSRSTLIPSPVKEIAVAHGLPVLQPERPVGDVFVAQLRHWAPELGVVVAYGHIIQPAVLGLPSRGMINVHASLLPHLRGAAPVPWAILQGHRSTGITIMQMAAGMDAGPILHQVETPIGAEETSGQLTDRLASLGADALVEALALLQMGRLVPCDQDPARVTVAPKINRAAARLDWGEDAEQVARRIRAFDPAPGAWTTLHDLEVKCFGGRPALEAAPAGADPPATGTVLATEPRFLVAAGRGAVEIAAVQPAGKARMSAEAWSRGRGVRTGQRFE